MIDVPAEWTSAIAAIVERGRRRVIVIGPTDVGKSSFVTTLCRAWQSAGRSPAIVDADPGQKMAGPPGTVTFAQPMAGGGFDRAERMKFIGSTSPVGHTESIVAAVARFADAASAAGHAVVVNTTGLLRGPGRTLKSAKIAALRPDAVVMLGDATDLAPLTARLNSLPLIALSRPAAARRKTQAQRAANRRAAFARHIAGAVRLVMPRSGVSIEPALPLPFESASRPVCALTDAAGEDHVLGILEAIDPDVVVTAVRPDQPISQLRLGAMWATPRSDGGWRLLDMLHPAWLPQS